MNQDGGPSLLVVGWTFCALSLIFTLLRAYVRINILNSIGTTDVLLFVAMVSWQDAKKDSSNNDSFSNVY